MILSTVEYDEDSASILATFIGTEEDALELDALTDYSVEVVEAGTTGTDDEKEK